MCISVSGTSLKLYATLDEAFCELVESTGLSYAVARQLSKLAVALLRGLKKSISAMHRTHFPEFSVQDILRKLRTLITSFKNANRGLMERIGRCFDARRRVFVICDDYLIPRDAKEGYRVGYFRDAVIKKIRLGNNIVDTIIASGGIEMTADFSIQPKNGTAPKTKRARQQLLHALAFLHRQRTPTVRIRVLIDGGYTNETVLPSLREQRLKYIGTINRTKGCKLFGKKHRIKDLFKTKLENYLTVDGKGYYYTVKTLNITGWGRHQVFMVRKGERSDIKFYLTNDLLMAPATFFRCQRERWWIEQQHRDLKQFCGIKQLFVIKKRSVEGRIALSYLIKNLIAALLAEEGVTMRDMPFERLIDKEFGQIEEALIQSAIKAGFLEQLEGC